MRFEEIQQLVAGVPFITPENARYLYDHILREKCERVLELGIAHGTATCYMAAALQELGRGRVDAVDLLAARGNFQPSAEEQVEHTHLQKFVAIHRMHTGYTWFLHDEIKRQTQNDVCTPVYDLCIIDGPKNWTIDGCAFFLADKLLKPGGWIIFDDFLWTYARAARRRASTDGISHRELSEAERTTPHIKEVFDLLVRQHPDYSELVEFQGCDWVAAKKIASPRKTYTVHHKDSYRDIVARLKHVAMRIVRSASRPPTQP